MDHARLSTRTPSRARMILIGALAVALVLSQGVIVAQGTWQSFLEPQLISKAWDGSIASDDSWEPCISDDGRYIAFTSDANDLTIDDPDMDGQDGESDVFRYDRMTHTMELVSLEASGTDVRGSRDPKISDDGRYVLFFTGSSFSEEDTNGSQDFYVKDMETGEYHFVDFYGNGDALGRVAYEWALSGDGSYIVFESGSGDLLETGKTNVSRNVWGYDLESDEATIVCVPPDPEAVADRGTQGAAISDDGRYAVLFTGNDWAAEDENGDQNLYIRDLETGEMRFVDWYGDGSAMPGDETWDYQISGDGSVIAFESRASLLESDDIAYRDVYAYDLESEEATLVSGPPVEDRGSRNPRLSDDGRYCFFYSGQSLAEDDVNGFQDFYMKDLETGEFTIVPVTSEDGFIGDNVEEIALSGDGLHIAFNGYYGGVMRKATAEGVVPAEIPTDDWNIYYVPVIRPALSDGATRLAGANRYATAVDVSSQAFPEGADTVVIATGEDWPDALGGAALAGAVDGPILLTSSDWLNDDVADEIVRLGARNAYILGGYNALSPMVETQLETLLDGYVWRIGGPDRYATSKAVANRTIEVLGVEYDGKACVTTGMNFPDAVGAAPLGAGLGWPVLLVRPTDPTVLLPPTTDSVVILGGEAAVGAGVESYLDGVLGDEAVDRMGGIDRYETSALVAEYGVDHGLLWNGVGITSGENYPDALSGGAALGLYRTTLLLTPPDSLASPAADTLQLHADEIEDVTFLGGGAAVDASVEAQVKAILGL